jgi:hypothetical protein
VVDYLHTLGDLQHLEYFSLQLRKGDAGVELELHGVGVGESQVGIYAGEFGIIVGLCGGEGLCHVLLISTNYGEG